MANAIVAYIPAIHQGYLRFFAKYPGDIFVLGAELVHETPRMDRDIRAIDPVTVVNIITALKLNCAVEVLRTKSDLKVLTKYDTIILPDEDISREFVKNHLSKAKFELVNTFLRWDRQISTTEFEVPAGRVLSHEEFDRELIIKAENDARRSPDWWRQVGAVITKDGAPILIGYNHPLVASDYTLGAFGDPRSNFDYGEYIELAKSIHGESSLIAEAAKRGIALEGSSIYVTTFPCPVCAKLVAAAGIKKVYYSKGYSMLDAEDILGAFGIEIVMVEQEKAPSA